MNLSILSYIMSKGMNRSILNVVLGGFGGEQLEAAGTDNSDKIVKQGNLREEITLNLNFLQYLHTFF